MVGKFKSICRRSLYSLNGNRMGREIGVNILQQGKEYDVVTFYKPDGEVSYYDVYESDRPLIVYMITNTFRLSKSGFNRYLYTIEEMRDIKLKQLLNNFENEI